MLLPDVEYHYNDADKEGVPVQELPPVIRNMTFIPVRYTAKAYTLKVPDTAYPNNSNTSSASLYFLLYPERTTGITFGYVVNNTFNTTYENIVKPGVFPEGKPVYYEFSIPYIENITEYFLNFSGEGNILFTQYYIEHIYMYRYGTSNLEVPTAAGREKVVGLVMEDADENIRIQYIEGKDRAEITLINNRLEGSSVNIVETPGQAVEVPANTYDHVFIACIKPLTAEEKSIVLAIKKLPPPPTTLKSVIIHFAVILHVVFLAVSCFLFFSPEKKSRPPVEPSGDSILGVD